MEYTRKSLRSAKDIIKKGAHVTSVLKDQVFRLLYDNRREIVEPKDFYPDNADFSEIMLDSKPLNDIDDCRTRRFLTKFPITMPFNKTILTEPNLATKLRMKLLLESSLKLTIQIPKVLA